MALKRFPGFIDVHVHFREPGATHKEDFATGSRAAITGGFTYVLDMPNNPSRPTISVDLLEEKVALSKRALCDVGFHYGTDGKNVVSFPRAWKHPRVFGVKVYCSNTTGELLVSDPIVIDHIFKAWECYKPILVHAEGENLFRCLSCASMYQRRLHVCHVAKREDLALVKQAKAKGVAVSVGVTPHHLFLTSDQVNKLGNYGLVKPEIGDINDQDALWEGLQSGVIDIVETDHAPHTKQEKESRNPPYGMPGLETALGLLMKASHEGMLSQSVIIALLHDNPKKIFHIPDQLGTYIELDPEKPFIIGKDGYETKCCWSVFEGWELFGKVETVVIRGRRLVNNCTML